jgi:hypothetical protein
VNCFTGFFGRWILKNVLSLRGDQSLKAVEQDYGLGPLLADAIGTCLKSVLKDDPPSADLEKIEVD